MANNPREVWAQMQPETPFSRYPVPNPQPSPGIAGIVQNIGQGAGNALAYRRELEKNYQAAAAAVAEAEMKELSEAASEKAKQDAAQKLAMDLQKQRAKDASKLQGQRDVASKERSHIYAAAVRPSKVPSFVAEQARIDTYSNKLFKSQGDAVVPGVNEEFVRHAKIAARPGANFAKTREQLVLSAKRRAHQAFYSNIGKPKKDRKGEDTGGVWTAKEVRDKAAKYGAMAGTAFDLWQAGGEEAKTYIGSGGTQVPYAGDDAGGSELSGMSTEELLKLYEE